MIRSHHSTPKEFFELVKKLHIALMLHDGEFRKYLVTDCHFRMWINANKETAFSIDESGDPLCIKMHMSGLNVKSLRVLSAS